MKTYLVGGAVRDELLGRPVSERDWVVVGSTPEDMVAAGYRPVGKDFPVFLHPETHEEYALARTERKTAPGYHGFTFHTAQDVTLEQDLARRDLTINALAQDADGRIVDYYSGRQHLEEKLLHHVSPAFREDPVRILRVARFAARYQSLGFRVADDTMALMRQMVASGEVDALVAERVWQELDKALGEESPAEFFEVLRACGALQRLFPEIEALYGVPQPPDVHPEIDCGVHTMMVLTQATRLTNDKHVRFAALTHDLGKATTPKELLPKHHGHEERSAELVLGMCKRLKAPNAYRDIAERVARYHLNCHRAMELRSGTLLKTLESLDAIRRPERLEQFVVACEADARGRTGFEDRPYPQADFIRAAAVAARDVDIKPLVDSGLTGLAMANAVRERRINAIKAAARKVAE